MKAKKSFGQHFLINENVAKEIAYSGDWDGSIKNVLEVGPGKGVLTKYLLEQDFNLRVVEADRDMVAYLEKHYPQLEDKIIFLDFLKLNMKKAFDNKPFYLIGNYPYNISSQIIFKMLKYKELIPEMVGMFQKELAERIVAPHGSKTYGVISILTQAYYDGTIIKNISPGSFSPPPKVNSAVIKLVRKENFKDLGCDYKLFKQVVKQSFSQRRKMLRNTLKSIVHDKEMLDDLYFNKRPEQLSVQEFIDLANRIEASNEAVENDA